MSRTALRRENRTNHQDPDERGTAGQLALELMHEIRNPLDALSNLTYLTLHDADKPEKVREYTHLAEEQIALLHRLAQQSLGYARVSKAPKRINLVDIVEAALRIHQRTLHSKQIRVLKSLPLSLTTEVYGGQMLQVVSNLVCNALQALPDHGTLIIRLHQHRRTTSLLIADNGHGIPAGDIEHVFDPFFTTRAEFGNGLGLSLSKRIVEEHHGRIQIRSSVSLGRSGTAFRISLPAA